ncbi:MAG: RNA degradosome polyphosphate kinase [Paracoccaceae bacterium]|tara:strand:- start:91 stop:2304 length:2214 start_codon:yes stop_codon:yes gene_type:complete
MITKLVKKNIFTDKVNANFLKTGFPEPVSVKGLNSVSPKRFFNRELSWLDFNYRVLEEAENDAVPILERIRFLSISGTNLDEFYGVRVAGWRQLLKTGVQRYSEDGKSPLDQLKLIDTKCRSLISYQDKVWTSLLKDLKSENIEVLNSLQLNDDEHRFLDAYFYSNVFSILSPLAIDPAHPFPFIPHSGLALALQLESNNDKSVLRALLPIPSQINRFIKLPSPASKHRYLMLDQLLLAKVSELFPGYRLNGHCTFSVLRDSDLEVEEEADDLVREFEVALKRRRVGDVVRLKLDTNSPIQLRALIMQYLGVSENEVVEVKGMIGLSNLNELVNISKKDLAWPKFNPRVPERVLDHEGNIFKAIKKKDMLLHHPYETFETVINLLKQAAEDPNVVAIKQTLYRTSNESPIVDALCLAAENGKSVTALVELKARFDEAANIRQAKKLEKAGAHVVYGFIKYKTHAKISSVVRRENNKLVTYTHFGTGNYHPITAKFYTDLSLFTCDSSLGKDATKVFNYIGGYAQPENLDSLNISPLNLKSKILEMIKIEISNVRSGKRGEIWAKMNSIIDPEIIDSLYKASCLGVEISLIIRGICGVRPGIKGLSENIRVKSIVGRFLEHSRIICFGNGNSLPSKNAKVFISSADWMGRNFDWRVETLVEIKNATVKKQVVNQIMAANLADTKQSWVLNFDGSYIRDSQTVNTSSFSCHKFFMENPSLSGRGSVGASDVPDLTHFSN